MKNANSAALGFRAHSGWAAAVALGGSPRSPEVIDRRRIELIEPGSPGGVQPYHVARTMDLPRAEEFIKGVIAAIDRSALLAVRAFGGSHQRHGPSDRVLRNCSCFGPRTAIARSHAALSRYGAHRGRRIVPGGYRQSRQKLKLAMCPCSGTRPLQICRQAVSAFLSQN